jgi:transposase
MIDQKQAAFILYKESISQKEIASIISISEKTISLWIKKEKWEAKRSEDAIKKQTSEEGVWEIINYQLRVLKKIKETHDQSLDDCTDIKELKAKLIERGDIDALQKLFTTIKGKEMEWTGRVKVIREFTEYLETENPTLAKEVIPMANQYLNENRN